jgi:hypothetical protein
MSSVTDALHCINLPHTRPDDTLRFQQFPSSDHAVWFVRSFGNYIMLLDAMVGQADHTPQVTDLASINEIPGNMPGE